METPDPSNGTGLLEPDETAEPVAVAPPVVAVLVTSDPGPWLEEAVASLAGQEYAALSVLVLDGGSTDDPTPRIASAMPSAYVRRLPANVGFAAAANEALGAVEGASFLLFCHDDVSFDSSAVRVMVEEAYRSNAGVVGPKIVEYDRPEVLLEVGMAIDHYGVPFAGIEPGELDQEQHDGVRDVFYVSSAAMLVRADLFAELSGFDPATFPGSDDLDLCWRARLAGARIVVAPDARVRHRQAGLTDEARARRPPADEMRAITRSRVRVLAKSYSLLALIWVLPTAFVLNLVEVVALLVARQPGRARALLAGWGANLRELGDVRRARKGAQSLRRVDDGDVRDLMVRGSARVRTFVTIRLHAGDRLADVSNRTREVVGAARSRLRRPDVVVGAVVAAIILFGSRSLVFGRVPDVGALRDWPGVGQLFSEFTSSWRFANLGSDAHPPVVFGLMAGLSSLLLGDTDLARTLVVAGALPLGAFGAYRLARPLAHSAFPALAASLAYGANPVVRNAMARGLLGPLVLFGLAPFLIGGLLRAGGGLPTPRDADAVPTGDLDETRATLVTRRRARVRSVLALVLLGGVAAAVWPPALLVMLVAAFAFALATPLVGDWRVAGGTVAAAIVATAGAGVLLAPWLLGIVGNSDALGFVARPPIALDDLLRFHTGPAGAGFAPWGLLVAALLPLLVATGPRLAWAGRIWMLSAASFALAWLPSRLDATRAVAAPEGVLVLAALGLALAIGIGVAAFADDLRRFLFGWRQFAAVAAALGLALPVLGFAADSVSGRWRLPARDWPQALAWMQGERNDGSFRVLWLGDPAVLPLDARVTGRIGYGLTRDGAGDVRASFAPPSGDAEQVVEEALQIAAGGRTARLGHLLAPAGVRYVALVRRAAPNGGVRVEPEPAIANALTEQLDFAVLQSEDGMVLYENRSWTPTRALLGKNAAGEVPEGDVDPIASALRADLTSARAVRGPRAESRPTGPGTLLWAEAADERWRAQAGGADLDRIDAFGFTNAFVVPERASVRLRFDGGSGRGLLVAFEFVCWAAAIFGWHRARSRRVRPSEAAG